MSLNNPPALRDLFEERARKGDAGFAVAYALLDVADAQYAIREALRSLGNGDTATKMGAIENLAGKVAGLSISLEGIGTSIADAMNEMHLK
jgi:hypothetical protein